MDKTIDMAREAGGRAQQNKNCDVEYLMSADGLKAFEAIVRADERDRAMRENAYVLAEREACAEVCEDDSLSSQYGERSKYRALLAATIRARGNT